MNNETRAQLQSISDNMSDLNYDEILFRGEPEDFDEMINGYAEVLRFLC